MDWARWAPFGLDVTDGYRAFALSEGEHGTVVLTTLT